MGARVELLHEHFAADTEDQDWLLEVGRRGWVVLTKDKFIRRRKAEFQVLLAAGVAAFVLSSGNLSGAATASAFVHAYPRIRKLLRDWSPPFVARVSAQGHVALLTLAVRRAARRKPD